MFDSVYDKKKKISFENFFVIEEWHKLSGTYAVTQVGVRGTYPVTHSQVGRTVCYNPGLINIAAQCSTHYIMNYPVTQAGMKTVIDRYVNRHWKVCEIS